MVSWILVLIAFFILAVQLFVTPIEPRLTTLAGFILIQFALFCESAFLAEKSLGNTLAFGVKDSDLLAALCAKRRADALEQARASSAEVQGQQNYNTFSMHRL